MDGGRHVSTSQIYHQNRNSRYFFRWEIKHTHIRGTLHIHLAFVYEYHLREAYNFSISYVCMNRTHL